MVVHRGGAHGGHYHAIIKDIDKLGNWTKPVCCDIKLDVHGRSIEISYLT